MNRTRLKAHNCARMPAEQTAQSRHYLVVALTWRVVVRDNKGGHVTPFCDLDDHILASQTRWSANHVDSPDRSLRAASVGPSTVKVVLLPLFSSDRNNPNPLPFTAHFRLGPQLSVMQVRYVFPCNWCALRAKTTPQGSNADYMRWI